MPSRYIIHWRPLLLLPPIPPSIKVFSNESTLRMWWPKYWSFSFSIIPSNGNLRADLLQNGLIGSPWSPRDFQESSLVLSEEGELPDVQAGFRKDRGTRDQVANIHWIIKKAREFQKNIYFCFIDYAKAFDCVQFSSVQFSRSVVSNCLRPHESQHARPPCPSPTPRVHSDSPPSSP